MQTPKGSLGMPVPTATDWRALRVGVGAWAALGVIGLIAVGARAFSAVSSVGVPLVVALVLGFLLAPAVDALEKRHVPRSVGAAIVVVGIVAVFTALGAMVVMSMGPTLGSLSGRLASADAAVIAWARSLHVPPELVRSVSGAAKSALQPAASGIASGAGQVISGAGAGFAGVVMALYLCFLMLGDGDRMVLWLGGHLGVPKDIGGKMIDDTASAIRDYFRGTTIVAAVTAVGTTIGLLLIGAPLPLFIGVVTFVFSYVPYVGALIAGALAVLLAFGAGGLKLALLALLVVLVAQLALQQLVSTPVMGSALKMNPVVVFVVTVVGGILAGALGAILAAPALTAAVRIRDTMAAYHKGRDEVLSGDTTSG